MIRPGVITWLSSPSESVSFSEVSPPSLLLPDSSFFSSTRFLTTVLATLFLVAAGVGGPFSVTYQTGLVTDTILFQFPSSFKRLTHKLIRQEAWLGDARACLKMSFSTIMFTLIEPSYFQDSLDKL